MNLDALAEKLWRTLELKQSQKDRETIRAALAQARADALEKAASVCDSVNNHDNPMTANDCAAAIRSLK